MEREGFVTLHFGNQLRFGTEEGRRVGSPAWCLVEKNRGIDADAMFEVCRHAAEQQPTTLEMLAVRGTHRAASALTCLPCACVMVSNGFRGSAPRCSAELAAFQRALIARHVAL